MATRRVLPRCRALESDNVPATLLCDAVWLCEGEEVQAVGQGVVEIKETPLTYCTVHYNIIIT